MAKSNAENKTPLIVALVFFILSTLGLGIFAYTLTQDVATAKEEAKKAKGDEAAAKSAQGKANDTALFYKALAGDLTEDDKKAITAGGLSDKDGFRKLHSEVMDRLAKQQQATITTEAGKAIGSDLGLQNQKFFEWNWPPTQDTPNVPQDSLLTAGIRASSNRGLAERRVAIQEKALTEAKATLEKAVTAYTNQANILEDLNKKFPDEVKKATQDILTQAESTKKQFQDETTQFRKEKAELEEKSKAADFNAKRYELENKRVLEANERLSEKALDAVDPFQFDKPQGKILRRYSDNLVDIDLGSAANLRPGQTFAVFPSDTVTRGMQSRNRTVKDPVENTSYTRPVPKGTVEVIDILGANLAQCRLTSEDSQIRDRVLTGDLLYNSFWKKGASEHIVLFGIFDLDGDGKDDVKTLVRDLSKVGVSVDAYFDLTTLKWVGELSAQTSFGIQGYSPSVTIADGNRDGKIAIRTAIEEKAKELRTRGVRVIRPRDFYPRIGYNAKLDVNQDVINTAAAYFLRLGSTPMPTEAPPASEPGKEKN